MQLKAICPGSFDPVTSGHIDIIIRASKIFDEITVAVARSSQKKSLLSVEKRVSLLIEATNKISNVNIDSFNGLLVDFCKDKKSKIIVKGLRAISDFENEFMMAQMNSRLEEGIETVFLMASPEYAYLSSSVVKEVSKYGGSVKGLVPRAVEKELLELAKKGWR